MSTSDRRQTSTHSASCCSRWSPGRDRSTAAERSRSRRGGSFRPVEAAIAETELAEVLLADGHAAEAIDHAQHAAIALDRVPTELAHTLAVVARAQLASGKLVDARATVVLAQAAAKTAYPDGKIRAALASAAVAAAGGAREPARATLAAARAEATQLGLGLLRLYCELAAAQLDGDRPRLTALAAQAKSRDLLRLVALATAK